MFDSQSKSEIDQLDWAILRELQANGRLSFSEIGRRVNSSQPTVAERVRRLEESGVITGYSAQVDRKKLAWPIMTFINLTVPNYSVSKVDDVIRAMPEISECHRVTGNDCFIIKAHTRTVEHLEELLKILNRYGSSSTSIVLSSIVTSRAVIPPEKSAE